jgi:hypothetical protein
MENTALRKLLSIVVAHFKWTTRKDMESHKISFRSSLKAQTNPEARGLRSVFSVSLDSTRVICGLSN